MYKAFSYSSGWYVENLKTGTIVAKNLGCMAAMMMVSKLNEEYIARNHKFTTGEA